MTTTTELGLPGPLVEAVLLAALPPCTPPSWRSIDAAGWLGIGRRKRAVAWLTMFDGQRAEVTAWKDGPFMVHRFTQMDGGDCSFESGQWIRIDPVTLEPVDLLSLLHVTRIDATISAAEPQP